MATYQNSVSNPYMELKGSALVSIAPYTSGTPSWTNVGPVRGIEVKEDMTSVDIEFDNTDKRKYISKQEMTVVFQQMQRLNPAIRQILRAGVDEFTTTAGSLVEDAEQLIASGDWSYNGFIKITNQNYNGSAITVNSVAGSVNTTLVADTDYFVGVNEAGEYGVTIIDSTTITTLAQTMTIDYDYTPSAGFKAEIGGSSELPYVMMKFETLTKNSDGTAGLHTVTCYRGQSEAGQEWVYSSDSSDDPLIANPITYRFFEDPARIVNSKKLIAVDEWSMA